MANNSRTSKFSPGDRAYFVIYAIAEVVAVKITNVFLDDNGIIMYDIIELPLLREKYNIKESDLLTFAEAKTTLLAWLSIQTLKIQNLTGL